MLATRLPGLLPPLSPQEQLEVVAVRSVSRQISQSLDPSRPFRQPHHTVSGVALVGGGGTPKPGEITLANHGVLFLDELPEFDRRVLEVLREPLESGQICISRAAAQVNFPARFQLVAAMNPCPCGYQGDPRGRCRCNPDAVRRYQGRISGPLLDRLDLQIEVAGLSELELTEIPQQAESSAQIRRRVEKARQRQLARRGKLNYLLDGRELEQDCALDDADRGLMREALSKLGLSARAYHRVLRVARTLADLQGEPRVGRQQLLQALSYRRQERATGAAELTV